MSDTEQIDTPTLIEEWSQANSYVRSLQEREADLASSYSIDALSDDMRAAAEACLEDPAFKESLRIVPRRWAMIDLNRLMVFQKHINLRWVQDLDSVIGSAPDQSDLVRIASGQALPLPHVHIARSDNDIYTLTCRSGELRFLDMRLLDPASVTNHGVTGRISDLVGLFFGFRSNFLSVLQYRHRLILTNGTHRAYALYRRGITRIPCLVVDAEHEDELDLVGVRDVRASFERHLRVARPPMFRDYFDERLCRTVQAPRTDHALQVHIRVRTARVPSMA